MKSERSTDRTAPRRPSKGWAARWVMIDNTSRYFWGAGLALAVYGHRWAAALGLAIGAVLSLIARDIARHYARLWAVWLTDHADETNPE